MKMNDKSLIDYTLLINESMYHVIKETLKKVSKHGLCGNHHFYITYKTNYKGVEIPTSLKIQYPEEITIVIQHNFKDLAVFDKCFQISLSFSGKYTRLVIPFKAIISFADPSEMFELEFKQELNYHDASCKQGTLDRDQIVPLGNTERGNINDSLLNNVISLEKFRKSTNKPLSSK